MLRSIRYRRLFRVFFRLLLSGMILALLQSMPVRAAESRQTTLKALCLELPQWWIKQDMAVIRPIGSILSHNISVTLLDICSGIPSAFTRPGCPSGRRLRSRSQFLIRMDVRATLWYSLLNSCQKLFLKLHCLPPSTKGISLCQGISISIFLIPQRWGMSMTGSTGYRMNNRSPLRFHAGYAEQAQLGNHCLSG